MVLLATLNRNTEYFKTSKNRKPQWKWAESKGQSCLPQLSVKLLGQKEWINYWMWWEILANPPSKLQQGCCASPTVVIQRPVWLPTPSSSQSNWWWIWKDAQNAQRTERLQYLPVKECNSLVYLSKIFLRLCLIVANFSVCHPGFLIRFTQWKCKVLELKQEKQDISLFFFFF